MIWCWFYLLLPACPFCPWSFITDSSAGLAFLSSLIMTMRGITGYKWMLINGLDNVLILNVQWTLDHIMMITYDINLTIFRRFHFNINMLSCQYRKSHCGDMAVEISTLGFPILVRWHLCIEMGSRFFVHSVVTYIRELFQERHWLVLCILS